MRKYLILMAVMFLSPIVSIQAEYLSLDAVLETALKNNFNLNIARNALEVAKLNNTDGNAGSMPYVNVGAGTSFQALFPEGGGTDKSGQISGGINAGWDIYDGGRRSLNRTILEQNVVQSDIALKNSLIQTIFSVSEAYYNIVKLYRNLEVTQNLIAYDSILAHIAQVAFESGNKSKTDLLLAKVDLNNARRTEISQYSDIHLAKVELNCLAANDDLGFDYTVAENFGVVETLPDSIETRKRMLESNPEIAEIEKRIELAGFTYELEKTGLKPTISLAGSYKIYEDYMQDEFSFSHGPSISAEISMPIYDAGETKRKAGVAKLEQETLELEKNMVIEELHDSFEQAFVQYRNGLQMLQIERETYAMAEENLNLNIELFRMGETTVVEVRQARTELIASASRLTNCEYDLKIAELRIRLLTDNL